MKYVKTQHVSLAVVAAVLAGVVLMLCASAANADTIGYWRFEDSPGFLNDSSGNGFTLTSHGNVLQLDNAYFDDPIPQTGQSNDDAAFIGGSVGNDWLSCADDPKFEVSDFTIEAYARRNISESRVIAGQWSDSEPAQQSWTLFSMKDGDIKLYLNDGSTVSSVSSGITISNLKNYFVAASFDLSDQDTGVEFYVKDLSADTWTTSTQGHTLASLHNSTMDFSIGGAADGGYSWTSVLDEVRLSNTVLSQGELLASVPEPSTIVLLASGVLGLLLLWRRRK